jgi:hypothetical protein
VRMLNQPQLDPPVNFVGKHGSTYPVYCQARRLLVGGCDAHGRGKMTSGRDIEERVGVIERTGRVRS